MEETIHAFVDLFSSRGYEKCKDGNLEKGYEKIVIYGIHSDTGIEPTHAARQLSNGWWTSKLGWEEDIEHKNAEDVAGPLYGKPIQFMRRIMSGYDDLTRTTQTGGQAEPRAASIGCAGTQPMRFFLPGTERLTRSQ